MRTTLVIDDDLYRRAKAKAALEGRRVTELVEEGLRTVLGFGASSHASARQRRMRLPIVPVRSGHQRLFGGMTQQEIHQRLSELQDQADRERVAPSD